MSLRNHLVCPFDVFDILRRNDERFDDINDVSGITLSEKTGAHLVASNNNYHYIKCIDICPDSKSEPLLAVGQANGKVVLATFGPTSFDALGLNGKEFGMFISLFDHIALILVFVLIRSELNLVHLFFQYLGTLDNATE